MNSAASVCPECGARLSLNAPQGLCPRCLFASLLAGQNAEDAASDGFGESSLTPPPVFGDYELLEELARGGMGVVYRARQISLNRIVALKMISSARLPGETEVKRFRAEAEAAASLEHPNIVPIYDVGDCEGRGYFTMKLMSAGSLAERTARGSRREEAQTPSRFTHHASRELEPPHVGCYNAEDIAALVAKVAHAVHFAHQRGILHRDLKPSNILLDEHGEPHVSDFGLARRLEADSSLTLTGAVLGTPDYMAPEQAEGRTKQLTTAADVWSLGAILYQMVTGRPPFHADTPLATLQRVKTSEPPRPSSIHAQVDRDLETICLKCLEKEPQHRYGSAEALAEDLERWLRHEPIRARPSGAWEHGVKWAKRNPARAALLGVALVAPVLIIALLLVEGARITRGRNFALQQEQNAKQAASRAEASELAARERAYAADMYAAFEALASDDLALARRLRDEHRPKRIPSSTNAAAATDLRGFEWRTLWQLTRGDEAFAFTNLDQPVSCLAFAPDGRTLLAGGPDGIHLWDFAARTNLGLFPGPDPGPPPDYVPPTREQMRAMLDASPALADRLNTHPRILNFLDATGCTNRTRDVESIVFTSDGQSLLVGSRDFVRCWNYATRAFEFAVPELWCQLAVPATGDIFAVVNHDSSPDRRDSAHQLSVSLYGLKTRRAVGELPGCEFAVAISPDAQLVAASGITNGLWLWRPATGEKRRLSDFARAMAFSPDGRMLAYAANWVSVVVLWNVGEHRAEAYLKGHSAGVAALAWSRDGTYLASAGEDQTVRLWEASRARPTSPDGATLNMTPPARVLRGHEGQIHALAFSNDGQWLASASDDRTIRFWRIKEAREAQAASKLEDTNRERIAAFDLVTGCVASYDGRSIVLRDPRSDAGAQRLSGTENQTVAGFSADGKSLLTVRASVSAAPTLVEIRDVPTGTVRTNLELPPILEDFINFQSANVRATLSPNGQWLALAHRATARVYALSTRQLIASLQTPLAGFQHCIVFSPDSRWFVMTDGNGQECSCAIFNTATWQTQNSMRLRGEGEAFGTATIDPTSRLLATGAPLDSIRIWNLATGKLVGRCGGWVSNAGVVWSPDGRTLATTRNGIRFYSAITFREIGSLPGHVPYGFTGDGRALVFHREDGDVGVWSPPTLEEIDREAPMR